MMDRDSADAAGLAIASIDGVSNRLICPVCNQAATIAGSRVKCSNYACLIEYPIVDSVPVLLNETDSIFSIQDIINKYRVKPHHYNLAVSAKARIKRLLPSLSNNISADNNVALLETLLSKRERPLILIVGCGETSAIVNALRRAQNNVVIESDVYIGARTQIVIDGHHIPFKDETFDMIVFQSVLEHVADPARCVQEAHRVLVKEGLVFATTPFMQQVHMGAHDFTRFTHLGHRRLFRAFKEIDSGVFAGAGVALGWSIRSFIYSLTDNRYARSILNVLLSCVLFWLKYLDYFTGNSKGTFDGASGYYFVGARSDTELCDKELIKIFKGWTVRG